MYLNLHSPSHKAIIERAHEQKDTRYWEERSYLVDHSAQQCDYAVQKAILLARTNLRKLLYSNPLNVQAIEYYLKTIDVFQAGNRLCPKEYRPTKGAGGDRRGEGEGEKDQHASASATITHWEKR